MDTGTSANVNMNIFTQIFMNTNISAHVDKNILMQILMDIYAQTVSFMQVLMHIDAHNTQYLPVKMFWFFENTYVSLFVRNKSTNIPHRKDTMKLIMISMKQM